MTKTRIACLVLLASFASCKRKDPREYPPALPRGFIAEAIKLTEAVVPYCDDLLAIHPCPRSEAGRQDFRNEQIVKNVPSLDHPFGDSTQVHDFVVLCETLEGHRNHLNLCDVRTRGPGTAPPAECEDSQLFHGWKAIASEEGEGLWHPVGSGCPQARFTLAVHRKTPKGGLATFIGNFTDPPALSTSPQ